MLKYLIVIVANSEFTMGVKKIAPLLGLMAWNLTYKAPDWQII